MIDRDACGHPADETILLGKNLYCKSCGVNLTASPPAAPEPASALPSAPTADAPAPSDVADRPRRRMREDDARALARTRNAARQPGEPVWTAYRVDPPDGKEWDVGTVAVRDLVPPVPFRDFEDL